MAAEFINQIAIGLPGSFTIDQTQSDIPIFPHSVSGTGSLFIFPSIGSKRMEDINAKDGAPSLGIEVVSLGQDSGIEFKKENRMLDFHGLSSRVFLAIQTAFLV